MRRIVAPLALSAALVAAPSGAAPAATTVDTIAAEVSGSTITVTGAATFGGQDPVEVGFDGTGDALVSQGVGLDIDRMLIQRADGSSSNLVFTLDLDGLTGGGIPEAFQYNWDIAVDGGADGGGSNWSIKAMRSGQASKPGQVNGWAALYSCVLDDGPTGGFTCSPLADLQSVWDAENGEIRISVPLFRINAGGGSTIEAWGRNGDPVWIRTSAAGGLTGFVNADTAFHDPYQVPGTTVELGIAPVGTPAEFVDFTTQASVSNGSFAGTLTAPGTGQYDVYARACFGSNCAVASQTVAVA